MPELSGQPAELRFTLEITRAATGLTETVEMVGHVIPEPEHQSQPQAIEGAQE
jgi:hypothetical protein